MSRRPAWGLLRLALLALLALLLLGEPAPAAAHARLLRSDPVYGSVLAAAPAVVQLWFSERIELSLTTATLYDASGAAHAPGGAAHLAPGDERQLVLPLAVLGDGTYTLVWRVISAEDGHPTAGTLVFAVGAGQALPTGMTAPQAEREGPGTLGIIVRWLQFVGLLVLVGGLLAGLLVLRPAISGLEAGSVARLIGGWRWLLRGALALLLPATLAALLSQALAVSGGELAAALRPDLLLPLLLSRWGALWVGRLGCLMLLAPLVLPASWGLRVWPLLLGMVSGLLALLTLSLISHAAVGEGAIAGIFFDWAHLCAAAAWAGGLATLLLALVAARSLTPGQRGPVSLALLGAFSRLAIAAVAVLIVSGVYSSLRQVPTVRDLGTTSYGRALLLKLALALSALLVGLYHWLLARPQLVRSLGKEGPEGRLLARLRGSLGLESGLAALVLLSASLLVQTPPPVDATKTVEPLTVSADLFGRPEPFYGSAPAGDLLVGFDLDALAWGERSYTVTLRSQSGAPAAADRVRLRFSASDMDMGLTNVEMERRGPGSFVARNRAISMSGSWQVEVIVRRRGREDVSARFDLAIR